VEPARGPSWAVRELDAQGGRVLENELGVLLRKERCYLERHEFGKQIQECLEGRGGSEGGDCVAPPLMALELVLRILTLNRDLVPS
jgi:hypothetical protein